MSARKRSGSKKVSKARPTAGNGSKRFRRTALALTFILLVGFAGYWAFREAGDPRFALSRVVVLGATHTPESDVLAAAAFPVGANVWLLDTRAAQRRVEDLPWVASANVERRWPNRVSVRVDERVPAASVLMPSGGTAEEPVAQVALIDSAMHVLAIGPPEGPAAGLPTLRITPAPSDLQPGADISGTDVERAYDALVQLRALGLRATEVDVAPAIGIEVTCVGGLHVILGTIDDFAKKVSLYNSIVPKIAMPEDVVYVDLRSVRAPTVLYR